MLDVNSLMLIGVPFLFLLLMVYLVMKGKEALLQSKLEEAMTKSIFLENELAQERKLVSEANDRVNKLEVEKADLAADQRNLRLKFDSEILNTEKQAQQFENLANRVLKLQSESLDHQHRKGMKDILDPLKEKLQLFEQKIENSNIASIKQHESLKEQIKNLNLKSEQVSKDANELAKALKGDYKKQGNWGELILESILDKSGLVKDREYFLQASVRSEDGKLLRPDVVIDLPDEKKIVIDSKVSLVAYTNFVNSDNKEQQIISQKAHVIAIKNHIEGLADKNYQDLYGINSPDFVLMFIPIDTAFSAALEFDSELYNYAFDKNIVIVTSSTLLATLKTVESIWRNDKQNRYAIQIAEEAGKMYDKFANFVDDMEKLGNQINTSQNTYHEAMKKLSTGKGNLLTRADNLKDLGAKANKTLPKSEE